MLCVEVCVSVFFVFIFFLCMLGLFLVLLVFVVYVYSLFGGDSDILVGIVLGIYGLV